MSKGTAGFGKHLFTLLAFFAVFATMVGYILYEAGTLPTLGEKYKVEAIVPTASSLTPGARVTIAGAEVGSLKGIERADKLGPGAKLRLELTDDRVFPLPRDSRVQVRTRSQVGENYVAIVVGNAKATIPDGGKIGIDRADPVVDVDEILSVLGGKTRQRTRTLFRQFGAALTGRGDELNKTLRGTARVVDAGTETFDVLDRDRETVGQLVDQLGRVMAAVGERGGAIQTIARQGVTSLKAIGDRDAALSETLRELPSTMSRIRTASRTVGDVSTTAAPVVSNLAAATRQLRPAIEDLAPTASQARSAVRMIDPALPSLRRLLDSVGDLRTPFAPETVPGIGKIFCELNPALRYLLPYEEDLLQIAFHLTGASHAYDATGHTVRLAPIVNENSLSGAPPQVLAASRTLLQSGAFTGQSKVINYDGYMKPGIIGKTSAVGSGGKPTGPASLKASGFKYPRVEADC